ncbi:MAG: LLM class flavin-dependent oxidoreductase [Hyphomicrobiales bacterium]|nr:LLM class flavin-dependent oxidoreductase [Hyphomicrobiales bacterium]
MGEARKIKLGMFIRPCGHHIAGWRHPDTQADAGVNFRHMVEIAQTAERGLFDMVFSADTHSVFTAEDAGLHRVHYVAWLEPFALLSAISGFTKNIGLVCTASTTFEQPYIIARRFASLDLISGGRAGWNVVTSGNATEALNFGREPHRPKQERYKRGREFVDVVQALWDSWDDDAFLRDKQSGVFFDRSKMHVLNHHGTYFDVQGPLNVARSPQGQPVLVQAGASDDGRQLAAETAEVVFTAHPNVESARAFYADVKGRMAAYGRDGDDLKILPGLSVTVGRTAAEAHAKREELQDLLHPDVGVSLLSTRIGFDLTGYPLDQPLPPLPPNNVVSSRADVVVALAQREQLTIRQLYKRFASARGHAEFVGSPADVVDQMELWFKTDACDGFNFLAPYFPGGLDDFVAMVVPEMQRRGLYRTHYEGTTLRANLGLRVPRSRYAVERAEAARAAS